jgi:beta-aspartyl-peptidase (threonine type)
MSQASFLSTFVEASKIVAGIFVGVVFWIHGCIMTGDNVVLAQQQSIAPIPLRYALAVHGGAGRQREPFTAEQNAARRQSLTRALKLGAELLAQGGAAFDAVEQVIRLMEDDPNFNAGKGAVFNADGGHELDASIMDGRTLQCGAIAGATTVKNPISLARLVMTKTNHVLLVGEGADRFAREVGAEVVDQQYFYTEARYQSWQQARQQAGQPAQGNVQPPGMGTVGCVARDSHGNLAAGTSSGGIVNKRFGRVGDTPIIGAGTYADNASCAVSCTGIGEQFIRNAVAFDISALMKYRALTLREAVQHVVHKKLKPGDGGIIAVAHDGEIWMDFNTEHMARAAADSQGQFEVMLGPAAQ